MKTLLRNIAIYALILFFLPQLIPGVTITGGINTILIGSFVLTIFFVILKPILSIISFPANVLTLGFFNMIINALLIYLLTIFVADISITAFHYHRSTLFGFITPAIGFNTFFAYLYVAFVVTLISSLIKWLIE